MSLEALSEVLEKMQIKHGETQPMTKEEYQRRQIDRYNELQGNLNEIDGYNCTLCKNKGFIAKLDENGCEVHSF